MSERTVRMLVAVAALVTLLLPWAISESSLLPVFWYSLEALDQVDRIGNLGNFISGLRFLLLLWAIPLVMLFNVILIGFPRRSIEWLYRISLLLFLLDIWYEIVFTVTSPIRFWASAAVVTAAVLVEVFLLIRGRRIDVVRDLD